MNYSKVYIDSFGYELAPVVVSSSDLEKRLEPVYKKMRLNPGQLEALTGIFERRYWPHKHSMHEGASIAAKRALAKSGLSPSDIGMVVYGGVCRDNIEPATACSVADCIGAGSHAVVYDVSNACLGVLTGMIQVANAIELGQIKAGIVVSSESARQIVDLTIERLIAAPSMETFKKTIATMTGGSGAVAVLLTSKELSSKGHRLLGGVLKNDVKHHKLCVWGPDAGIMGAGAEVFMETDSVGVLTHGAKLGKETFEAFKKEMGLNGSLPDKVICHQVGSAHQKLILESLGIPKGKDYATYPYLGNIGTVSLPLTAAIASEREFLKKDDLVAFLGIGSGLNCMMLAVEW
ncbi:MAG: 3-oxoacyl-ACP synthase III [Proteobacteria bacterium]|nr:3-oxoacyl-ACP synthase III [Pseudomonadota bacterium]